MLSAFPTLLRVFVLHTVAIIPWLFLAGSALPQEQAARERAFDRVLESLSKTRTFRDVAISPDSASVAWVENARGQPNGDAGTSTIHVAELGATRAARRVGAGSGSAKEHSPAWSPDGKQIAFLSDLEKPGQLQLYVCQASGRDVRKLLSLQGALAEPRWSPDGKQLSLLHTEGEARLTGPTQAARPEVGEVGDKEPAQRLQVIDADSGRIRTTSPAGLHIHEYDWSPEGKELAVVASPAPGDSNWYVARLYAVSASTGDARPILQPHMQIAAPRWSPDGKTITFIGGLMSDEGANGGDIFTVAAAGGKAVDHTVGQKASPSWLAWLPSSRTILFAENIDGEAGIGTLNLDGNEVKMLWTGPETISAGGITPGLSIARDGQSCALVRQSFDRPPEVWAGPIGKWEQITHANADIKPSWGQARSLHWDSDSWRVQGWLLYPSDYEPGKRYPLVVSVHGGPAASRRPAWPGRFFDLSVLAHMGYFVFFPNPRGSYGQGEAFTRANIKDFGHGDLRDIMAGVDTVIKTVPIDRERLAIAGWSYGGYMTMWAVTQTTRFRAAVAGAGIANWQSYYGQNGIDQWLLPYFGATVYDDPAVYARSSPIEFIKRVRTPTLVLVGERDAECPVPQSREFWHALRTLKVPTQLVIYPGEGHGFSAPRHRRDAMKRTFGWLERYIGRG
jgi:dipeptidyl aminopeptidase/acylaminoacyl peptidase